MKFYETFMMVIGLGMEPPGPGTLSLVPVPVHSKQNFFHPCFGELWDPCPCPVVALLLNLAMGFLCFGI